MQYETHDPSFRLADGQPNDGYLLADGLHLSNRDSNRLVKNLGLITTNTNVTSRKKGKQHQRDEANTPTTNENRIVDQDDDDDDDELEFSSTPEQRPPAALSARHSYNAAGPYV